MIYIIYYDHDGVYTEEFTDSNAAEYKVFHLRRLEAKDHYGTRIHAIIEGKKIQLPKEE